MPENSKIKSVEVLHKPMSGAAGISRWNPIFVRVTTEGGLTGIGEVGLAYGVGAIASIGMIQALSEAFVIGADAMAHEALWERIYRRSFWAEGGGPIVSSALSAIDTALWDIKGKALKQPVQLCGIGGKPAICGQKNRKSCRYDMIVKPKARFHISDRNGSVLKCQRSDHHETGRFLPMGRPRVMKGRLGDEHDH